MHVQRAALSLILESYQGAGKKGRDDGSNHINSIKCIGNIRGN